MRALICAAATLALTITTASAAEEYESANYMLPYCKLSFKEATANTPNAMAFGQCAGIIYSVAQIFLMLRQAQAAGKIQLSPPYCTTIPDTVDRQQLINVVVKWADAHPQSTHEPFILVVMLAIRQAWPCKH